MDTQEVKRPIRGYVRKKKPLDLNVPPSEALEELATAAQMQIGIQQGTQDVGQACGGSGSGGEGSGSHMPAAIDLEAIDDEVVISSPSQFAEARKKSRRNNNQERVFQGASVEDITRLTLNSYTRRRIPPNRTVIDCEQYINLESGCNTTIEVLQEQVKSPAPPPPPVEPTFTCPICMCTLVEEASTKCGHIFCTKCIKAAIAAQNKCPTCRKKLTKKDIIRVYLPCTRVAT